MNIACVLKSGGMYTVQHVRRLRSMINERHDLYCLTDVDMDIAGVRRIQLKHDFPGWWSKLELFRPRTLPDNVVYLDLDVDVVGPLTSLRRDSFTMVQDFVRPEMGNSSVMAWAEAPTFLYNQFVLNPMGHQRVYKRWPKIGDQAFIFAHNKNVEFFNVGLVRSYRLECVENTPSGTSVVAYHGSPKPWDL